MNPNIALLILLCSPSENLKASEKCLVSKQSFLSVPLVDLRRESRLLNSQLCTCVCGCFSSFPMCFGYLVKTEPGSRYYVGNKSQPAKAWSPMWVAEFGMVKFANELQR